MFQNACFIDDILNYKVGDRQYLMFGRKPNSKRLIRKIYSKIQKNTGLQDGNVMLRESNNMTAAVIGFTACTY